MLNFQPDGIVPNLCLVNTLLTEGSYDTARLNLKSMVNLGEVDKTDYRELIDLCSQNKEIGVTISKHLSRALVYTENKWYKRALREYEAITKMAPSGKLAYNTQIDILRMTRQDDKAIEICKKVIELQPGFPNIYLKLADIYKRNGQKDEAETQYRKVINIDKENVTAHLNLGVLLESKDLFEESINLYKRVLELDSSSVAACNNLAWIYALKVPDKLEEALKLTEKANELSPNNPAVLDTLGWVYCLNGLYDKATTELEAAVKGAMWQPTIRYHLGMTYYKKGMQRKAMTELQHALKINRTFHEADEAREMVDKIKADRISGANSPLQN